MATSTRVVCKPAALDRGVDPLEQVGFDRDEDDFDFVYRVGADELIIPDHFLDRKGHVLLRLEGDDALDFILLDRGQFDEAGEDRLPRDGVIDRAAFDPEFAHHRAERFANLPISVGLRGRIGQDFAQPIAGQDEPAVRLRLEMRPGRTFASQD